MELGEIEDKWEGRKRTVGAEGIKQKGGERHERH